MMTSEDKPTLDDVNIWKYQIETSKNKYNRVVLDIPESTWILLKPMIKELIDKHDR